MMYSYKNNNNILIKTNSFNDVANYAKVCKNTVFFAICGQNGYKMNFFDGNIVVTFPKTICYINKPILLSCSNVVIDGNGATIVGGSLANNKWIHYKDNIYYMDINTLVDDLYINNTRCTMARYPKKDYAKDCFAKDRIKAYKNMAGGYIHALHSKFWGGFSYKITKKTIFNRLKYVGGTQNNRPDGINKNYVYFENIFEDITEPFEWCFKENENRIYAYLPADLVVDSTQLITNECIFDIDKATDITIKNLNILGTVRTFMKTKEPLLRSDWTIYRGGAIHIKNSNNILVNSTNMQDIGSNAFFIDANCNNVQITNSHIKDIGASGACFVGNSDCVYNPLFRYEKKQHIKNISLNKGAKSENYPKNCGIENCIIENVGTIEKQASGVEISMAYKILVKNCSIFNTSRAGINIGDGTFGGHIIDGCDVFDCVKETGDHGCFNSWGRDRFWNLQGIAKEDIYKYSTLDCIEKTTIKNSRFRCDRGWDIDLDDGSSNYEICNNLCLNGGIKLREGFNRYVHHNVIINNTLHLHVWYKNSLDIVENNIVFKPYNTVLMDNGFGKSFNYNILHKTGVNMPVHAYKLSNVSGMDKNSYILDCKFDKHFNIQNDYIKGFSIPCEFGVKGDIIKQLSSSPIIPKEQNFYLSDNLNTYSFLGVSVKDIETDGEMSAYGTSSHNGVLVKAIEPNCKASKIGIQVDDVIIDINGIKIDCIKDIETIKNLNLKKHGVTVIRKQLTTKL